MDEQRIEIHHEIVRKTGILIIISLLIEATWGDLFFFQVSSDLFWSSETFPNFLVLEGDDVIQTVAGVSGIPKRFFRGETGAGFVFFWGVEVGKIWKVFHWKKYSCIWDCEMCFCWWWIVKDFWFQLLWFVLEWLCGVVSSFFWSGTVWGADSVDFVFCGSTNQWNLSVIPIWKPVVCLFYKHWTLQKLGCFQSKWWSISSRFVWSIGTPEIGICGSYLVVCPHIAHPHLPPTKNTAN